MFLVGITYSLALVIINFKSIINNKLNILNELYYILKPFPFMTSSPRFKIIRINKESRIEVE